MLFYNNPFISSNLACVWIIDMARLIEATLLLLEEKSVCQLAESDSDNDDNDSEHDEVLMDAVSDLLPAFAKAMGSHFAPVFSKLFGPIMKFAVGCCLCTICSSDCNCFFVMTCHFLSANSRKLHAHHKIEPWWLHVLQK